MNTLLFDLSASQPTNELKFHGGSEYAKFLFNEGIARGHNFDVIFDKNYSLHNDIENLLTKSPNIKAIPIGSNAELQELLNKNQYTRFYSALPYDYGEIEFGEIEFVFTIHGIREIECPSDNWKHHYQTTYFKQILVFVKHFLQLGLGKKNIIDKFEKLIDRQKKKIIVVSSHTKYSLLASFPSLESNQLKVFYSPFKEIKQTTAEPKDKYFLLISTHRWIKNNYRVIKAFDELFTDNRLPGYKVVCLGASKTRFLRLLRNKNRFVFKDYVDEKQLEDHFSKAFSFIYPTLNEGFGYPPIQAMQTQTPIIAACNTSVAEVCGSAALYFDNKSILEIKNRILQLTNNDSLREELISAGTLRVEKLKTMQKDMLEEQMKMIFEFE